MTEERYYAMFDAAEAEHSLPQGYLKRTAQVESNMDPLAANPKSSAKGMFQFIDSTAQAYGVDPLDVESSTKGAAQLAADNSKVLEQTLGRKPTSGELYLAHQQGATGASKLLRDPNAKAIDIVGADAIRLNGGREDMTAGEFAKLWTGKFNKGEDLTELPKHVANGDITSEEANMLVFQRLLEGNILDLSMEEAEAAYDMGLINDEQANMYLDFKESPTWFRVKQAGQGVAQEFEDNSAWDISKDIGHSIQRGMLEGIDGIINTINEPINALLPNSMQLAQSPLHNLRPDSKLTTGHIAKEISAFMVPFGAVSRTKTLATITEKVMKAPLLAKLQPGTIMHTGIQSLIHGTVAGAAADYASFNPADPGLANMFEKVGALPEFMEFMITDPEDPAPYNRMRRVLEGAALGGMFEVILAGAKGLKRAAFAKHGGDPNKVAAELIQGSDKYAKAQEAILERDHFDAIEAERLARKSVMSDGSVEAPKVDPLASAPETPYSKTTIKKEVLEDVKFEMPKELKGMKPRYGYKQDNFDLEFESDFDKACYTLAQKHKSKSHDALVKTLKETTGLSEEELIKHGQTVKNSIKDLAKSPASQKVEPTSYKTEGYKMPDELAEVASGYTYKGKPYDVSFENDFDRAAYILFINKAYPKYDVSSLQSSKILEQLKNHSGMTEAQILKHGELVNVALEVVKKTSSTKKVVSKVSSHTSEAPKVKPTVGGGVLKIPSSKFQAKRMVDETVETGTSPKGGTSETASNSSTLRNAVDETSPTGAGTKQGVDEIVPPGASGEVGISGQPPKKGEQPTKTLVDGVDEIDRDIRARRIINTMGNDSVPVFHDKLIENVIKADIGDPGKLLKLIYRESHEAMEEARRSKGWAKVDDNAEEFLEAVKENAELTGHPLAWARKVFKDMDGMTHKVRALNEFFTNYFIDLQNTIKEAHLKGMGIEKKLELMECVKLGEELMAITYGVRAEASRTFNQYRRMYGGSRFDFSLIRKAQLDNLSAAAEQEIDAVLKAIVDAPTKKEGLRALRIYGNHKFFRGMLEYTQLNLLWSPATHNRNVVSQAMMLGWKTTHRSIAGVIQFGLKGGDVKQLLDVAHWYTGMAQGLADAFKGPLKAAKGAGEVLIRRKSFDEYLQNPAIGKFYRTLVTGKPIMEDLAKEGAIERAVDSALKKTIERVPILGKPMAYIFRSPFNMLAATDDAFKSIAFNGEAYSRMYREGTKRGLSKAEFKPWMNKIGTEKMLRDALNTGDKGLYHQALDKVAGPQAAGETAEQWFKRIGTERMPRNIVEEAAYVMRDVTFQHNLKGTPKKFEEFLNHGPLGLSIRILAMPFYKIMVNMLKFTKHNSLLGIRSERIMKELQEGGIQQWETMSRIATGSAMIAVSTYLAGLGLVTGQLPKDMRNANTNANVPENSFWTGKRFVSMIGMEPLATFVSLGANLRYTFNTAQQFVNGEDESKFSDVLGAAFITVTDPIVSMNFMQSLKDLQQMMVDYERMNVEKWSKEQLGKMFPSTTGWQFLQRNFSDDPYVRRYGKDFEGVNGIMEIVNKNLNSKKMFLSRHSVYGTPVPKEDPILYTWNTRTLTEDPVAIEMLMVGCDIPQPVNNYTKDHVTYRMTNQEYDDYMTIISKLPVQKVLQSVIDNPIYQGCEDADTKARILKKVVSTMHSTAKEIWRSKHENVTANLVDKLEKRAKAILGVEADPNLDNVIYHYQEILKD